MLGSSPHEGGSGGVVDMEAEGEAAGGGGEGAPYAFMAARASTCSSSAATAAGGSATVGRAVDTSGGGVRPPQDPRAPHMQLQLKEATNYLRYLLHCLIVRSAMGSPHRQTGQSFWQEILQLPTAAAAIGGIRQQQQQQGTAAAVAAVSAPGAASSAAAVADAAAASGATQPAQRHSGGRRLLIHRLSCSSPGCVVCSKTCELFRRGLAVQAAHFPPPPPPQLLESGGLDALVEDLSRSIATIHL
ncbi:hypothetical protein HXX76_009532 [Chlamydomonas incerta]|uniref:Uncharacterized protein n=1 Tax=Chlamydomonas incerta TaxID=51695 RepID=A0A835VZD9_CHLIN|nr:hypothetical protein HXX76_009532 [Chlamydomonas incerta]|eukprot:KAG2431518.1 hypothetical protein HXX76_009532 [Chlamydomonas incerta]